MCLIAWKLPIGLPNCSRTFAYSVAVCNIQRANPAASAASTAAATSARRWADTDNASAGAESSTTRASGREKSVAFNGSIVTPSAPASISTTASPAGSTSTPAGSAPSTYSAVPDTVLPSNCTSADNETPATRSPDISDSRTSERSINKVARAVVATGPGTIAAAASSTIAHRSSTVPSAPPCSSERATPKIPSCANPS
jgi:hypothetical protein